MSEGSRGLDNCIEGLVGGCVEAGLESEPEKDADNRHVRQVTQNGKTVHVEVERFESAGWILRIVGRYGQVSEWTDLFPTPLQAITTGLTAINYEGIDDFYEDPIFAEVRQLVATRDSLAMC